jgi:SH3 domain-containing YSC84-like protein 1
MRSFARPQGQRTSPDAGRRRALAVLAGPLLFAGSGAQAAPGAGDAAKIVAGAEAVLQDLAADHDFAGLRAALPRAKAVLIFPEVLRAGFLIGGSGGSGVLMVREPDGGWLGPAFYTVGSASLGLQAGATTARMVMLVHDDKVLDRLYGSRIKLGADASAALGAKGVEKTVGVTTDFTVYAKVKGAFAGIAFDGAVLDARQRLNKAFYGLDATPVDILVRRTVRSAAGNGLRAKLARLAG